MTTKQADGAVEQTAFVNMTRSANVALGTAVDHSRLSQGDQWNGGKRSAPKSLKPTKPFSIFFGELSGLPWQQVAYNLLWKFVTANEKLKVLNCGTRGRLILADVRKGNIDSEIVSDKRAGRLTVEALITDGLQK